jgi:hypothetical protein
MVNERQINHGKEGWKNEKILGWLGRDEDRIIFFLSHPELEGKGSERAPILIPFDKIEGYLTELAGEIDKKRRNIEDP